MSAETDPIWTAESVLELARGYQPAAILAAAADLDLFTALAPGPRSVGQLAGSLGANRADWPSCSTPWWRCGCW
ncbi:MAG: hypothetical protein M5U12_08285 [Verrucomicrobia bacterium]|nr:hypothetical protein [Verrucomicrobiota bacterium]